MVIFCAAADPPRIVAMSRQLSEINLGIGCAGRADEI
jgi:hypothetical protein